MILAMGKGKRGEANRGLLAAVDLVRCEIVGEKVRIEESEELRGRGAR